MKKVCYSLLFISNFCFGQNPLVKQWDYRFGGTISEELSCIQQTSDGGYILGGNSSSDSSGDKTEASWGGADYWIVKIDSLGTKQWDKAFGGNDYEKFYTLLQTSDGGYILGGYSWSDSSGDKTEALKGGRDFWVVKIDSLGIKQWDKDFGGSADESLRALQQTPDGGYILGGDSWSDSSGDKTEASKGDDDYWVVKIDSLGIKQWDKDFGGDKYDYLTTLQQTSDGGYILGGVSYSGISGDKTEASKGYDDYWVVKIDSLGIKQWDKDFGGNNYDDLFTLKQISGGGYILGGYSISGIGGDKTQSSKGGYDYWIIKTDSLGVKQWDKDFGGSHDEENFQNIEQTNDKGYLMAGSSNSPVSGNKTENNLGIEQSWIVKTDSTGAIEWDKTLLTTSQDVIGLAVQSKDGCFVMANWTSGGVAGDKTQASWSGGYDYWIVKFCDTTHAQVGIDNINSNSSLSLFPNPTTGNFTISFSNSTTNGAVTIEVVNALGQKVFSSQQIISSANRKTQIDISNAARGIYFVEIKTQSEVVTQKLLME